MTAPLSAGSVGLARAQVTHGVRQVTKKLFDFLCYIFFPL